MADKLVSVDENFDFPAPVKQNLETQFARTTAVRDIRDFLQPGETLDQTDTVSISPILQRAVDALGAEYTAQSGSFGILGLQIYVPNGRYRVDKQIDWRAGVGLIGESSFSTTFFPRGSQSFIDGSGKGASNPFTDCNFTRFTVDGKHQTASTYTTAVKGIFVQHMKRSTYESVIVRNTWATGFGVDHLEDTTFINCTADGNGRGIKALGSPPATSSGHSGFGIGTGGSALEAVSIINCIAKNNGLYGIFTEKQSNQTNFPNGLRVIGCISTGNYVGFKDCGSTGAIVQGNQFMNNTYAGVALDGTPLVPTAGKDGILAGNVIAKNATGVVINQASLGGYRITGNEIYGNTGHGVLAPTSARIGRRYTLTDNHIHENGGDGVRIQAGSEMLTFSRNQVWGNTGTDFALLGPTLLASGLVFTGNDFRGAKVVLEQHLDNATINDNLGIGAPSNVRLVGISGGFNITWTAAAVADRYEVETRPIGSLQWTPVEVGAGAGTASVAGLTNGRKYEVRVAAVAGGKSEYATAKGVAGEVYDLDNFNRPNNVASLGSTREGKVWENSKWIISENRARASSVESSLAFLDAGRLDVAATATFVTTPPSSIGMSVRAVDNENWVGVGRSSTTDTWVIQKRAGGTFTTLVDTRLTPVPGDVMTIRVAGNTLDVTINDSLFTVTDPSLPKGQKILLRGTGAVEVDDLIISQAS